MFPSQIAADAWAVEALRMGETSEAPEIAGREGATSEAEGPGRAVDPDRLIGWDRFKELFLSERKAEKPANRVTRTLWAALVVSRQSEKPFLRSILGTGRPSPSFVGFLAKLPPSLASLAEAAAAARQAGEAAAAAEEAAARQAEAASDPLIGDLLELHRNCSDFMATRGLFEPSWEKPVARALDRPHILIAPELVEDWDEWRESLATVEGFGTFTLGDLGAAKEAAAEKGLLAYPGAWEEYRDVFLRVAALIDAGTAPEDIGVTVADLDSARPWIEEAAANAAVPLAIRRGTPLASSPFGRLLSAIEAATGNGFGLPHMKALLLDRFATWRDAASAAGLVRFGIEHHAFASWTRDGREVDVWEESFRVTGKTGLQSWYRLLKTALRNIAEARDFAALRAAVTSFRRQFLDEGTWSAEEARLVQRCMEELEALARAEADYAKGERLPSPFALWLATLRSESYVPQRHGSFVQAYPWRVSALLPFRYHFLLGCGFEEVSVRYGSEAFLREDQKELLGRNGRDATRDFLRAYLLSGEIVLPCHAAEGIGGWSAPHPFFAPREDGEVAGGVAGAATGAGAAATGASPLAGSGAAGAPEAAPDPIAGEVAAWSRSRDDKATARKGGLEGEATALLESRGLPSKLLIMQKNAFARFSAIVAKGDGEAGSGDGNGSGGNDGSGGASGDGSGDGGASSGGGRGAFERLDGRSLAKLAPRYDRDGLVALSHSLLAEYRACPCRWLAGRALRVRKEILDPGFFDALLAGEMAHKAIEWLFEGMRPFGPIDGAHLSEYRRLAENAAAAVLPPFSREKGPFLEPMFEAWSPLLTNRLLRLVDALVEDPGWDVGELETEQLHAFPEAGFVLDGRIDRLARRGEELSIVDYKKGHLPKGDTLVVSEGSDEADEKGSGEADRKDSGDRDGGSLDEGGEADDADGEIASKAGELANTQVAAYVTLLEAAGMRVTRASFWSIEKARALVVIGEGGLRAPGGYEAELSSFRALATQAAQGIRAGRFGWAPPSSPSCVNCDFKPVCRSHYSAGR